jgi:hypothetical protein
MIEALIPEYRDVDLAMFKNEIFPAGQPAVLRGLVADWPAVAAARQSPRALGDYIRRFDRGGPAEMIVAPPAIKGRMFYGPDMVGLNFERGNQPFGAALDRIFAHLDDPDPPTLYMGSSPVRENFPGFAEENRMALLNDAAAPRIWIGNAVTVTTHFDASDNLACVVGGRRRFTLFPPDQLANLYVGPLEFTPAGPPVSMVSLEEPDFARYPRFHEALAAARVAELEPGDALFIPYMWWHHIQSLSPFNVLVNYWWNDAKPWAGVPFEALIHAVLAIRDLPPERRANWRRMFDHYVFEDVEGAVAHLAPAHRGILGELAPPVAAKMRAFLHHVLGR